MVNVRISTGGCLCGAVRFETEGPLREVLFCHCGQCRKASGHFSAFTAAPRERIRIVGQENLAWFESSPGIRRGFCATCGSKLFWDDTSRAVLSIAAGAFDAPSGLRAGAHVHVADAGDYYVIADDLPRHGAMTPG